MGKIYNRIFGEPHWKFVEKRNNFLEQAMLDMGRHHKKEKEEHTAHLKRLRSQHKRELEKACQVVEKIVDASTKIKYTRQLMPNTDIYRVCVDFDSRFYGGMHGDELEYVGRYVGEKISHEIRTSKFIQSAREDRYG